MKHRHLNHQELTLAAIDDVIARGRRADWAELRSAMLEDETIRQKILRVCVPQVCNPYALRYHFWKHYAKHHAPA